MEGTNKNKFTKKDIQLADFCWTLAHPARIIILKTIARNSVARIRDFENEIPLAYTTILQHLDELLKHGIIKKVSDKRFLNNRGYKINLKYFEVFNKLFNSFYKQTLMSSKKNRKYSSQENIKVIKAYLLLM